MSNNIVKHYYIYSKWMWFEIGFFITWGVAIVVGQIIFIAKLLDLVF